MIIIHAADIHLGSPLGGLDQHDGLPVERIRSAPLTAFVRIAELCEEREAAVLLIAGDLFDGNAGMPVIREAHDVLRRIAERGTRVIMIRGNHDATSKMQRRLPQIDGVHELSTTKPETLPLEELGLVIHGRGFESPRVTENIVASYPPRVEGAFNIGMLHTSFDELLYLILPFPRDGRCGFLLLPALGCARREQRRRGCCHGVPQRAPVIAPDEKIFRKWDGRSLEGTRWSAIRWRRARRPL